MMSSQADYILSKFPSRALLAGALSQVLQRRVAITTVQHWKKSGWVPSEWHEPILRAAKGLEVELTADDFVNWRDRLAVSRPAAPTATQEAADG